VLEVGFSRRRVMLAGCQVTRLRRKTQQNV
jgi:hypothetical protein